ncbi:MAG: hypothetical protein KDA80_13765 [Planctomycetaceae bacterium]|nr:hypothetical protein [Planctomycetaceae bacterium]
MPQLQERRLGDLNCRIVIPDETPKLAAVLCHGFGAPGDDLVPLTGTLMQLAPETMKKVLFVYPEAPLSLADQGIPGGRAWWMLDMEKLARASRTGEFRDLSQESPPRLPQAREELISVLDHVQRESSLSWPQIILGGFSQGSMLATDLTLHLEEKPAGLVIWSGTLLNQPVWSRRASGLQGLPILQTHGTKDPILPFQAALWLKDLLTTAGANLRFVEFQGPHTIPYPALELTAQLIDRRIQGVANEEIWA